jgi:radical SAM protein with 4Fe4S-binding SPASM domain
MSALKRLVCASPWQEMIIDLTGEVVPCCFWSGYGNSGKPLGNTNTQTIDEIWNGEAYRELRRRNTSGDLTGHPCGTCPSYRWNHTFPSFDWPINFRHEQGYCYLAPLPAEFQATIKDATEPITLYEAGQPLSQADALHDDIRQYGGGRYSVWGEWLYFSASDNSSPLLNQRAYELRCGEVRLRLSKFEPDSVSGRNMLTAYEEYLAGREEMTAKPTKLTLISTADCNIDCPHCSQNFVRLVGVQHRPETIPDVLNHIPYLYQFTWQGGEPYLIKRLRQFIDEFQPEDNPNLSFGFTSNATMITAAEAEKLQKFPHLNASISIDSFYQETFEKIRAGANFNRVMTNLLRLMAVHDDLDRKFSVGMIVCKSNLLELPGNLRRAIDYDIGLMLSPVVSYPVTEQLNLFEDFEVQTTGWSEALDEAEAVVAEAKAQNRTAIRRIDPGGVVVGLRDIYRQMAQYYADALPITVVVHDPHHSLAQMRRPGLLVTIENAPNQPVCYLTLDRGPGEYTLRVPRSAFTGHNLIYWVLLHNLLEDRHWLASHHFTDDRGEHLHASAFHAVPMRIEFAVPPFRAVNRPRNIAYAHYGESHHDGVVVTDPLELDAVYHNFINRETVTGQGLGMVGKWPHNLQQVAELYPVTYSHFVDLQPHLPFRRGPHPKSFFPAISLPLRARRWISHMLKTL